MKVLGDTKRNSYICEIYHDELEMYLNVYHKGLKKLYIGEEVSLSTGYRFDKDIKEALKKTEEFLNANKKIIETLTKGISFLGENKEAI